MPYLREALASLEAQTRKDFEILLWDNGSTDDSLAEARRWIPSRLPGRIVDGDPLPLHLCLARMVEEAKTELCARMDADDVCLPERFEVQAAHLNNNPDTVAVGCQMELIDQNGANICEIERLPDTFTDILSSMLYRNPLPHGAIMFRREAVLEAGNYRERQPVEDLDLWMRLVLFGKIINLKNIFLKYRQHPESITNTSKKHGELNKKITKCLLRNVPDLFRIPDSTYFKLINKSHPVSIIPLLGAARRIAALSGSTTLQVLKSREYLFSARCLTAKKDVISKLIFLFLSCDNSKSFISELLGKMLFLPGIRDLKSHYFKTHKKIKIRRWIRVQQRRGSTIEEIDIRAEFLDQRINLGSGVVLEKDVSIAFVSNAKCDRQQLVVGDNVFIGRNTVLSIYSEITIGDNALIGAYCYITSCNHAYESRSLPIGVQGYSYAPVSIKSCVWIGTHVVILPGVTIAEGAIVGAGSVVTCDIPAYQIWGGSPARFIRNRPGK